jgi:hypothetical protein
LPALRQIGLSDEIGRVVHQNHLLRLAREGAQTTVYHLKDFEVERRHATLVAILLDTQSTLIDEILDMHDRMIGSAFAKAKRSYETSFREAGKAINEKVRLYAKVGQALIRAKEAEELLSFSAAQLGLDAGLIELYRKRQPTISEHQQTSTGYLKLRRASAI